MSFVASLQSLIGKDESIVLPISMSQPLERGERLAAILSYLKAHKLESNTTILIADYLNRHNNISCEEAIALGDEFLAEHQDFLSGFKVVRWKGYMESKGEKFTKALEVVEAASKEGSLLYNKIRKTWEKCLSATYSFESSIKYQQEEYALLLCKDEFKHLIYPKRVTNAMAYIYKNFEGHKPNYHYIKISEIKNNEESFDQKNTLQKKERRDLHVFFQAVIEHVEHLLGSDQLSEKAKKQFAEELENTVQVWLISSSR